MDCPDTLERDLAPILGAVGWDAREGDAPSGVSSPALDDRDRAMLRAVEAASRSRSDRARETLGGRTVAFEGGAFKGVRCARRGMRAPL